ncbi:MAG: pectinesterase family protein, partial [candidate division Zixibacteria bacterium]
DEKRYPQPTAWGNLPGFALFLRHVRGITLDGVMMGVEEPDVRSPVWVDDVEQLSIKQTRLSGPIGKGPFVKGVGLTDYEIEPPLGWKGKADELIQILDPSQPGEMTLIVAADGSGQFTTVQAAVDFISADNKHRITIFIRNGDYPDQVRVNRSHLTLRGEDRKKTRLCAEVDSPKMHQDPERSWATVEIDGVSDVHIENLTITNPFPLGGYAVVLSSINNATRLSVIDCDLISEGGDTVSPWSQGLYYFRNCWISGTYHFFGPRGTCYATDCQFWCLGSDVSLFNEGIYDETDKLVIRNSTFDGPKPFGLGSYFRDAAWYFIDCKFSDKLKADGRIFRNAVDNYTPKWGENRVYFADCKSPDYPWLKDNITASQAKTKEAVTVEWTLRGWLPEAGN